MTIGLDPVIARLGPFELGWHGILTLLAVVVGVWLGQRYAARAGLPPERTADVVIAAVVGGIVGARLFHVLDHLPYYAAHPLEALAIWEGGIAVYGAFLGGIAAGLVAARRAAVPIWLGLDAAAVPMLVAQAIGRLGCLSNGDAWGAPTGAGWGIVYVNANALLPRELLGVPTHPYPLYEIAAVLLLALVLTIYPRRRPPEGALFLWAALGYGAIRFALSFVRQEPVIVAGLQEAQLVALATAALAAVLLVRRAASGTLRRAPGARPAPAR